MIRRPWIVLLGCIGGIAPIMTAGAQSDSGWARAGGSASRTDTPTRLGTRRPEPTVVGPRSPGTQVPVAMLGYSPVSLLNNRQWVKGREPFKAVFDGAAYLFADRREMQVFAAAPERYLPVLGGDCVVHFAATGKRRPGLLRHGVVHNERLFFLSSSENKQVFVDNASRYVDVDLALDGNCPVCVVELNKEIAGQPELAAVLGGYRYLFPGAQQREMFLAQPMKYAAAAHAIAGSGLPAPLPTAEGPSLGAVAPQAPSGTGAADGSDASGSRNGGATGSALRDRLPPSVPVAVSGYCPVSILDESRWVRGTQDFGVVLGGRRYLLAGAAQRQAFLEDPLRYVPALGGDCVVTFKDDGRREEGSVYHAVIHRGRQYLFAGPQQKAKFKEDPDAYADVDLALAGLCPVTLVEAGKQVEGKPEFTAWHEGLRFKLAGRDQLETFESNPQKYALEASSRMEEAEPAGQQVPVNPFD